MRHSNLRSAMRSRVRCASGCTLEALEERLLLAPLSSLPLLSSRIGAPVAIHVDFDGTPPFEFNSSTGLWASGPAPGNDDPIPAFTIDGNANDYTQGELDAIVAIWTHVAEKFSPFDINVTTIAPPNYNDGQAVHAIVGGSDADWYMQGAGGVAPLNAFTNSRPNSAFTFSADAIAASNGGAATLNDVTRHFIAETVAHEVGHTFGLQHQSVVDGSNNILVEYSNGNATTAPIMGGSGNNSGKRGIWFSGPTSSRDNNNNLIYTGVQDDLATITRPGNFISYRPDEFGSSSGSGSLTVSTQTGAATGAGLIETNGDQDAFIFTAIGPVVQFTVNNAPLGGMLAPTLELIPLGGGSPSISLTTTNTSATLIATSVIPGAGYILRVSRQGGEYGSVGQYTISGNVGSFASVSAGTLTVTGYETNNNLLISYNSSTDQIVLQNNVFGGSAVQQFPRGQVSNILVLMAGGDDLIQVLGAFTVLGTPVAVNGGAGNNTLVMHGTSGADSMSIDSLGALTSNLAQVTSSANVNSYILSGFDGADTFEISGLAQGRPLTIHGGGGNDVITVGTSATFQAIRSPVVINGDGGNDTVFLATNAPFSLAVIDAPVTFNGGADNDTLNIGSGNLDAVTGLVSFNGGTNIGGNGDRIILHDDANSLFYDYVITPTSITRDPFFAGMNYSNTSRLILQCSQGGNNITIGTGIGPVVEVNGNGGDDNFIVGGGLLAPLSGQVLNGGNGTDRITFDDHLRNENRIWDIHPGSVIYGGAVVLSTTAFEAVGVLAGNGNDEIVFYGNIGSKFITVDGGGGNDTFNTNAALAESISIDGGSGHDYLHVDDRGLGTTIAQNLVYADHILRYDFVREYIVSYRGIDSLDFHLPAQQNSVYIAGTAPVEISPNFAVNIFGNTSADTFVLNPRDGAGNLTINRHLVIDAGAGSDSLLIDDAGSSLPIDYAFAHLFASSSIGHITGMGPGYVGIYNTLESLTINAGGGNDTFDINQYRFGTGLTINGGGGDDTVNWTPMAKDLGNITSIASFTYNGGEGHDAMQVFNDNSGSGYSYFVSPGVLSALRHSTGAQVVMNYSNIERVSAGGSPLADGYSIFGTSPGVMHELSGLGGDDSYSLASIFISTLQQIQSVVKIDGAGGTDTISLNNSGETIGRTFHITGDSIGAFPGDDLFGIGGRLGFSGVTGAITIHCGSGGDTIYAVPNVTAAITINGNNPASAPGDALNLALAGVQNHVISNTGTGAGNVTSANRATLSWTGIETGPAVDDVAPAVAGAVFQYNGPQQAVPFQFSEDVSASLGSHHLVLNNLTTGQPVPPSHIALTYDSAANTATLTFPGYANGILPDGVYEAVLSDGVSDLFGNRLAAPHTLGFFVLAGDANRDGKVDIADLGILAANWQGTGRVFSQGDYNNDGVVNIADLGILAANWQKSLDLSVLGLLNPPEATVLDEIERERSRSRWDGALPDQASSSALSAIVSASTKKNSPHMTLSSTPRSL